MMDLLLATSGGEAQAASGGYVDDVFSAYTYTGNGSTQNISGPNFADNAGLVWLKNRTSAGDHYLFDTVRGALNELNSNNTQASASLAGSLTAFLNNGFSVGNSAAINQSGQSYVGWQFRRAPKFFDVVTYTGNGTANVINHSLGVTPGWVIVKSPDANQHWGVWALRPDRTPSTLGSAVSGLSLNTTSSAGVNSTSNAATTTTFDMAAVRGGDTSTGAISLNTDGVQYVAYLFAHDQSAEGIIQCGSFTTDGSGNATVNLGWEPQFSMVKASSTTSDWIMLDSMRGWNMSANDATLLANISGAETVTTERGNPTATGFDFKGGAASQTYIYLAIRRPNKPPTTGTQVYSSSTSSGVVSAGFPVDLHIGATRTGAASNHAMHARLTGGTRELVTSSTAAEATITDIGFDSMTGLKASLPSGMVNHFFRRATGFFDVVCYTGTGVARTVAHNLGVAPELMIVKSRSGDAQPWGVYVSALGATKYLLLNQSTTPHPSAAVWGDTDPTASVFTVGGGMVTNLPIGRTYVAYLFASLPGISKVGSYTGNGTSQTINCGFASGARFILIKRTDATGDWYVWDSVRGIIAANDPHLSLNTTAAEVTTDDSVDPDASGFIVNQNTATNINVSGGSYIFLAIA